MSNVHGTIRIHTPNGWRNGLLCRVNPSFIYFILSTNLRPILYRKPIKFLDKVTFTNYDVQKAMYLYMACATDQNVRDELLTLQGSICE